MFKYRFIIFTLILLFTTTNAKKRKFVKNPIVNTNTGKIKGSVMTTRFNNKFYAFRGIRYAKPPIGQLRFQAPAPVEYWDGIFDATEDGPACLQPQNQTQSEDCLRLNIYTRYLTNHSKPIIKKPVIALIPGGKLILGSGASSMMGGPSYIMEQDVVFVTHNYRLSALGFLSLNISDAPGNAGMKDQVLALKWIKSNINRFGGDPNDITLLGHSAGAFCILLHLVSPMSRNLFNKAIVMSPAGLEKKLKSDQIKSSRNQAIHAGCENYSTPQNIYDCLRDSNSSDVVEKFITDLEIIYLHDAWNAVIEPDFGQDRFLIEDPFESFKNGNYLKIPIVIGMGNTEFAICPHELLYNETLFNLFCKDFHVYTPICFQCERNLDYRKEIGSNILKAYNVSYPFTKDDFSKFAMIFGDGMVNYGIQWIVDAMHNSVDVFYYHLTFHQRYSRFMLNGKPYGIEHADEVKYLFNTDFLFNQTGPENIIYQRITRFWTQFALTGNPNKKGDRYLGEIDWQPYTTKNHNYLEFGDELVLKKNLLEDRFKIWYKYFP